MSKDSAADGLKGVSFARRALEVADDDPNVLANAAIALAYFGEDIGAMTALADRAVALNPSFARGWYTCGVLRCWGGEPDAAIQDVNAAIRFSPRARVVYELVGASATGRFQPRRIAMNRSPKQRTAPAIVTAVDRS